MGTLERPNLHGNAIVSACGFEAPRLVRLPGDGGWFSNARRERRIGGRIALIATVRAGEQPFVVACAHLESHADSLFRAAQMQALLSALDEVADSMPVLIGGDFNTRTGDKESMRDPLERERLRHEDPAVFTKPFDREPLFEAAASRGYTWQACNTVEPTERIAERSCTSSSFRLDWFFARGLDCVDPVVIPALDTSGEPLSDHDAITVDVRFG
jgi:endonuclease/exonuclease/phosphatase family metal-dependent hydrolase